MKVGTLIIIECLSIYNATLITIDNMKTLVFGASTNPLRYSYLAIERLKFYSHKITAIGGREVEVHGVQILIGHPEIEGIHTITMYMGKVACSRSGRYYSTISFRKDVCERTRCFARL